MPKPAAAKPAQVAALSAADQARRRAVLQDAAVWKRFDDYFSTNSQAKELRTEIESADCDMRLLGELAISSFDDMARDEPRNKRERGKQFRQRLQTAITGYESAVEAWRTYSKYLLRAAQLVELNEKLADEARSVLLVEAEKGAFNADRMGRTRSTAYLVLMKQYIADKTHWADKKVLTAIVHLVAAGQCGVEDKFIIESRPRDVIRKAMQTFERVPENSTIIDLLRRQAVKSPYPFFPKL